MSKDMHTIISLFEQAKAHISSNENGKAKELLISLLKFYNQEAELSEPALRIASNYAEKAEKLLIDIQNKLSNNTKNK